MKRFLILWVALIFSATVSAGVHYINHIAEEGWTTSITVYNETAETNVFDLYRWDESGVETVTAGIEVPANSFVTLTNADFGYLGTARINTALDVLLNIKLAYRYRDSHSLCEFFIPNSEPANTWMVPNPFQSHFDWFGMAIANFGGTTANVTMTAWKNGAVVDTVTIPVDPDRKSVNVSSGFWSGVDYGDVDLVTFESDNPIPAPMSITGNDEQDRHVFFLGQMERDSTPPETHLYTVPHVAEENWTTAITAYNNKDSAASIILNSWTAAGDPDVVDGIFAVPAHGTLALAAGTDFAYRGIATITTEDDVQVKLTYQYGESESLCEFFLMETTSTKWFIPNSIHDWFDWFGLAVCNPTNEPVTVALDAYKDGTFQTIGTRLIQPHTKVVGLANDFWPNLSKTKATEYDDVDMVVIRSSAAIPTPLSITGNSEQDRHVFFLSNRNLVNYPFPDSAFEAYILENFDTDENGFIDAAEAAAVIEINTPGTEYARGSIRDLTGVDMFTNLITLDCGGEQLSWLPDISGMTELGAIYANDNYLVTMPPMDTLSKLQVLNCNWNQIEEMPPFTGLSSLTFLYLGDNQLQHLPDLSPLTDLTLLVVDYNQLSSLPGLSSLTELTSLQFPGNQFTSFPDISGLANLRVIICSFNPLAGLPDLSPFPDLDTLHCDGNDLTEIPGLGTLVNLTNLRCAFNEFTDLSAVAELIHLRNFVCNYNNLTSLPDLSGFTELRYLYLTGNPISEIQGLASLSQLRTLYADNTAMTDFSAVAGLTTLERLYIQNNAISILPDLSALDNLNTLYCENCGLADIPDVTGCAAIDQFRCYWNQFGPDDCPLIQAIEAMGLSYFDYNPQDVGGNLICE